MPQAHLATCGPWWVAHKEFRWLSLAVAVNNRRPTLAQPQNGGTRAILQDLYNSVADMQHSTTFERHVLQ